MTPAEREALILSLEPLVQIIARKKVATLPLFVRLEDLVSAAWLGAIDAVDRFDPERQVELKAYAKWRIHGALNDYLRSVDHLSRDSRAAVKRGEMREPIIFSIDKLVMDRFHHADNPSPHEMIADEHADAERARRDARLVLRSIFGRAQLRPRNARILKRWMEGETLKAIAESHGMNESRASQVCSRAIRKLRAAA